MKILAHFPFLFFPIQVAYMVQFPFNVITHCSECSCMLCCAPVLIAQHFAVLLLCLLHSTLQCYSAIVMLIAQHFAVLQCYCYAYYTALCSATVLLLCLLHSTLQCYSAIVVLIAQHFAVLLCFLHSILQCYCYAYYTAFCSAIVILTAQHFAVPLLCLLHGTLQCYSGHRLL